MSQDKKDWNQLKKKDHAVIFEAVRSVIHHWDPYGLLELGCPKDEFDSEIEAVVRQINRVGSANDAVHVLSRVFSSSFEPKRFRIQDCQASGEELFRVLVERSIVVTAA